MATVLGLFGIAVFIVRVIALAAAVTFAPVAGAATDAHLWTLASPPSSPPARAGHAMAYDPVGKQVLAFGASPLSVLPVPGPDRFPEGRPAGHGRAQ